MTSTDTLPIPRPTAVPMAHEHSWLTESRHPTSEGVVVYVRCGACTARRIDLRPSSAAPSTSLPPIAMSRSVGESPNVRP
ncbi:hypothetical protein [Microbacterium galbinum]|uniref:Uncharacterized protein n=1 Tax=Microbacterium galbinum TaxID=2851646 RepID=A0ABY4IKR2_9MICO|nr:hypothetical protein [Microbacterium galbinum]UPL13350.1 hypothetical protein KV396_02180 [Microbacterium galbinum]